MTWAADGREALEAVKKETVDMVLLDINMPVMNGLEAAQAIRALDDQKADLPLVAITSDVSPMRLAEMRQAGFDVCMEKPVRRDALFRIILGALSRRVAA